MPIQPNARFKMKARFRPGRHHHAEALGFAADAQRIERHRSRECIFGSSCSSLPLTTKALPRGFTSNFTV